MNKLVELIDELYNVWRVAKKPTWEETKQMVLLTLLIALVVGTLGLLIFILIQYIL